MKLNNKAETELENIKIYAISISTPEEHELLQQTYNLDNMEILTDAQYEFGTQFGFVDLNENAVYRGYLGVNAQSENMVVSRLLIGDHIKDDVKLMRKRTIMYENGNGNLLCFRFYLDYFKR
ncbi:hypothetical protein KHA80_15100 [Anaerobacillus sp. HL2]|nr:hypothetical protein KHA80_15100 [Anaerobacillus sp. HL2]